MGDVVFDQPSVGDSLNLLKSQNTKSALKAVEDIHKMIERAVEMVSGETNTQHVVREREN